MTAFLLTAALREDFRLRPCDQKTASRSLSYPKLHACKSCFNYELTGLLKQKKAGIGPIAGHGFRASPHLQPSAGTSSKAGHFRVLVANTAGESTRSEPKRRAEGVEVTPCKRRDCMT